MKTLYFFAALIFAATLLNVNAQNFWERVPGFVGGYSPTSIAFNSVNDIYAGFAGSLTTGVAYSTNDGDTWTQISPNRDIIEFSLALNGDGHIFVGYRNFSSADSIFRSTDNGNSWTLVFEENSISGLVINQLNGYVFIGTQNGIYRSVNNGVSWTQVHSGGCGLLAVSPNGSLFASLFVQGVANFYRSVNNGTSWTVVNIDPNFPEAGVGPIAISNGGVIYILAGFDEFYNGVFRSTNNGTSWVKRDNGLPGDIGSFGSSLTINSLGHVFIGTAPPNKVYRSANNGLSWHPFSGGLPTFGGPVFTLATSLTDRVFGGNGGFYRTIYSTTSQTISESLEDLDDPISDGSPSETTIHIPTPNNLPKKNFSPLVESVEISIDEVLHTRTGDLTFTLEHNGVTVTLIAEAGGDGQNFISTLLSDDSEDPVGNGTGPFTGFYKPEQPLSAFNGMDPYGDWTLTIEDGYAGNDGILNGWSIQIMLDSPILNAEEDVNTISDYALYQNYPNPFNPSTVIGYQLPVSSNVTLKVYDLLGREVATLVNEEKQAGTYEVTFSASDGNAFQLSSGVYFYQLKATPVGGQAGNEFVQTKKFVLMK